MENKAPDPNIRKLRRRARALDVAIRTKRSSRSRPETTYDLIDLASGRVLSAGLTRPDLEADLGRIAEERAATPTRAERGHEQGVEAASPQPTDAHPSGIRDQPRFCESCGEDQAAADGTLTRTADGAWVCANCSRSIDGVAETDGVAVATALTPPVTPPAVVPSTPATVESTPGTIRASGRRRALSGQPPLRDRRGVVRRSDARRWIPATVALLGVVTLVVATQQPAFRQVADGGGVLGETATATSDGEGSTSSAQTQAPSAASQEGTALTGSAAPSSAAPASSGSIPPSTTPASAGADLQVGQGTVTTWTGPYRETRMQVIVPVTNGGKDWVALPRSASQYQVVDGRGRELASGLFTIALPGTIGPNETAYLVETVSAVFVAGSGTPRVKAEVSAVPAAKPTASLSVTDVAAATGTDGGLRVTGVVHNDGPSKTGWLVAGGVLVDPKGQPVGAVYDPGRVGPVDPGATATFDTSYPGAPPPGKGSTLVGVAFEALDQGGS
ncbi:MAG: hypothetical protein ACJ776_01910 [Chloroflexota bacterium]